MEIVWTQEALDRLIEIEDYIAKDSPERAAKFVDQIIEHAESLYDGPRKGRTVPEIANPDIRELNLWEVSNYLHAERRFRANPHRF